MKFDNKAFGKRLRSLRMLMDWTQEQAGEASGLNSNSIRSYEAGRAKPKLGGLMSLASAFDVPVEWLMTGEGKVEIGKKSDPIQDMIEENKQIALADNAAFGVSSPWIEMFEKFLSNTALMKELELGWEELLDIRDALTNGKVKNQAEILLFIHNDLRNK